MTIHSSEYLPLSGMRNELNLFRKALLLESAIVASHTLLGATHQLDLT